MKQSLQLRIGQQLALTPQLQQAIRLLQLSTLELQTEIQQAVESNVMLEEDSTGNPESNENDLDQDFTSDDTTGEMRHETASESYSNTDSTEPTASATDQPDLDFNQTTTLTELPVDSSWDEGYDNSSWGTHPASDSSDDYDPLQQLSQPQSLYDSLLWQVQLAPLNELETVIATLIIDEINADGYFTGQLETLALQLPPDQQPTLAQVESVLQTIQNFEPTGVGARNLAECLQLQLKTSPQTPSSALAQAILEHHMTLLATHDYTALQRKLKISKNTLKAAIDLILSLHPKPGQKLSARQTDYIVPDIFVQKRQGQWQAYLNQDATPRLRINPYYSTLIKRADHSADNLYLKHHLQEARCFISSLQSRYETLLKVATCIVEQQQLFFDQGEEFMRPLILRDIADELHLHESTISRATTQKYMHTPRGIFEFKYFFSSHVNTDDGSGCSSTAIRALMKKLIAAEDTNKPLSDHKIAELLSAQGINVARRTVAKYREAMAIAASNERKRLL